MRGEQVEFHVCPRDGEAMDPETSTALQALAAAVAADLKRRAAIEARRASNRRRMERRRAAQHRYLKSHRRLR